MGGIRPVVQLSSTASSPRPPSFRDPASDLILLKPATCEPGTVASVRGSDNSLTEPASSLRTAMSHSSHELAAPLLTAERSSGYFPRQFTAWELKAWFLNSYERVGPSMSRTARVVCSVSLLFLVSLTSARFSRATDWQPISPEDL